MSVNRLFFTENGSVVNLKREHGITGYSVIDSTSTVRGSVKIMRRKRASLTFRELVSEIDSLDEPETVKRTAKMILKDFIEYELDRVNRFIVKDRTVLVLTIIYYARVINRLPAKLPPVIDKRVKRFLFMSDKYAEAVKRGVVSKKSAYLTIISNILPSQSYINSEVYLLATILDKYVKPYMEYSTKTIVGAVLYYIALNMGLSQSDIAKLLLTMGIQRHNIKIFLSSNEGFVRGTVESIPKEERKIIEENIEKIIEKISKPPV